MEWQPHHMRSLTVRMDCSMPPIFSLAAHVCRSADDRKTWMCSNSLLTWKSVMVKIMFWFLASTCFRRDIISDYFCCWMFVLISTKTFPDFVCRKGLQFIKKSRSYFQIVVVFCILRGDKSILGIFLWYSGLLLMALPFMMNIYVPYITYDILMMSIVIGQFMIELFQQILLVSVLMATLLVVGVFWLFPFLFFASAEVWLVALYYVKEIVISYLGNNNGMFHISRVKIRDSSAALLEYDNGVILEVQI